MGKTLIKLNLDISLFFFNPSLSFRRLFYSICFQYFKVMTTFQEQNCDIVHCAASKVRTHCQSMKAKFTTTAVLSCRWAGRKGKKLPMAGRNQAYTTAHPAVRGKTPRYFQHLTKLVFLALRANWARRRHCTLPHDISQEALSCQSLQYSCCTQMQNHHLFILIRKSKISVVSQHVSASQPAASRTAIEDCFNTFRQIFGVKKIG